MVRSATNRVLVFGMLLAAALLIMTMAPRGTVNEAHAGYATGRQVVHTAKLYLGYPYRPPRMDCSGFTSRVFRRSTGIYLPDSPVSQYYMGRRVARAHIQPGDLVFFNERGRGISHVGIAVNRRAIIHASAYTGTVTITPIVYIHGFAGARRIV